ncbi:ABC transporter permease [Macrococcus armenti]|uniref:YhgE/Pip domain-containing protein n=1 Tax=Macrococcus armenti TaxID=2875764 RepID=UPI001CCCB656|nr:ABC transporter permease [Macrococcus armenti]UBH13282.1 ABC transporter permease [Macrococcus armenti]UBH22528.1 ABC transporter permease [Macrococcus armenti]
MRIFKNKLFLFTPIVAIIIISLLATAFYPAYNPKPKAMPVAIVNLDKGIKIGDKSQNIGKTFVDKVSSNKDITDKVKFININTEDALADGFKEGKYYGAFVISEHFSEDATSAMRKQIQTTKMKEAQDKAAAAKQNIQTKVASGEITLQQAQAISAEMKQKAQDQIAQNKEALQPIEVKQGNLKIIINQGASTQASQITDTMLTKFSTTLNDTIRDNALKQFADMNISLSGKDIKAVTNPVHTEHKIINKLKDNQAMGNAPMLLFTPIWLGSLITSVMLYFAFRQSNLSGKKNRFIGSLGQITAALITAIFGGFIAINYVTHILGLDVSQPLNVSIYISIAMFGFIMLILGLMSVLGMRAVPLFMLALFFSMQLLIMPKEMLPKFYQTYIIGWNPFRLYADGLRELIYLNQPLTFNTPMQMYLGLAIVGIILIITASQVKKHVGKRTEIPA